MYLLDANLPDGEQRTCEGRLDEEDVCCYTSAAVVGDHLRDQEAIMGTRTCSWCGESGHDKRSCTVPPNAGKCSVCGYHGHDKRNCPKK